MEEETLKITNSEEREICHITIGLLLQSLPTGAGCPGSELSSARLPTHTQSTHLTD